MLEKSKYIELKFYMQYTINHFLTKLTFFEWLIQWNHYIEFFTLINLYYSKEK